MGFLVCVFVLPHGKLRVHGLRLRPDLCSALGPSPSPSPSGELSCDSPLWLHLGTQVGAMLATFSSKMRGPCGTPPLFLLGPCSFSFGGPSWPPLGAFWARFWRGVGFDFESFPTGFGARFWWFSNTVWARFGKFSKKVWGLMAPHP